MADIKLTAFIEDTVRAQSGGVFVLKTSETHRRQVNGEWVTDSRTFRDVKVSRDSGIQLDAFTKGDRVDITGTEKTEKRSGTDRDYFSLVVWASSITRTGTNTPKPSETATNSQDDGNGTFVPEPPEDPWATTNPWPTVDVPESEVPF